MRFSGRGAASGTPDGLGALYSLPARRLAPSCARVRVAANSNSTAAGSRSSATTRMNHLRTVSLSAPMGVARYRTGPRSASTVRSSSSTAAFSTFRSARAFASTVSLSARLLRLACRRSSSAARSSEIGDVLKMARTERR
jgi:hypothetical protein